MLFQLNNTAMNEVIKTIYTRRSVRKYKSKAVPKAIIEQIIDAGRMAPSAMNSQPWKFLVLTDKQIIQTLSKETAKAAAVHFPLLHGVNMVTSKDIIFHGAPVVIFLAASAKNTWAPLDIGMCAQNMMLAAKSLGLETCPVGLARFAEETLLAQRLKILKGEEIQLAIVLGYGDEKPKVHRRKKNNSFFLD
jgi:nitroreductase